MANGSLAVDLPLNTVLQLPNSNQGPVGCRVEPNAALVFSVFGRFGAVVAQTGDYNASQVTLPGVTGGTVHSALRPINVQTYNVLPTNTGAVNDANLAVALSECPMLYWPAGAYPSAASIPNLHTVRHRGPGRITRGADTFWLEPTTGQANTLYVATTGSTANDGLTAAAPIRGFQDAVNALRNYGPVLDGTWTVQLAAGTYNTPTTDYGTTNSGLMSRNPITFAGPNVGGYPNVPTAIVARNGGATQGWAFSDYMNVAIRDVRFQNFTTGQGVIASYLCRITLTNVHTFGCLYGLYAVLGTNARVVSGIFDANSLGASSHGLIALDECFLQVGTTGGAASDVVCQNAGQGVGLYESTSSHVNAILQDNALGLRLDSSARCNCDTADFRRNTTAAIRVEGNSHTQTDGVVMNTGTADANARNIVQRGGGVDSSQQNTATPRLSACTQNQVTRTGDTAETAVWSELLFPAKAFPTTFTTSSLIELLFGGSMTGTAGTKTVRFRLDTAPNSLAGTVIGTAVIAAASAADYSVNFECSFGNASQRGIVTALQNGVLPVLDYAGFSVATNNGNDWYLTVTIQLANAADSMIINHRRLKVSN